MLAILGYLVAGLIYVATVIGFQVGLHLNNPKGTLQGIVIKTKDDIYTEEITFENPKTDFLWLRFGSGQDFFEQVEGISVQYKGGFHYYPKHAIKEKYTAEDATVNIGLGVTVEAMKRRYEKELKSQLSFIIENPSRKERRLNKKGKSQKEKPGNRRYPSV